MEWKRAITILIVSFVMLNIFMLSNLWFKSKPTVEFTLTSSQADKIKESLNQRGVVLKADISKEGRPQSFLEVSFQKLDKKKIVENFFGKKISLEITEIDDGNYIFKNQQLIVEKNGFITFFNNNDEVIWPELTKEKAENEAMNFMMNHGGVPDNAVLDKIIYDEASDGYLLEYVRYYDDFFIENSYVTMLITPSGIKTYYQCWLNVIGYAGKKRQVISPLTAIMRVITEEKIEESVVITEIQQGYYSKLYDADRWQSAPVWRIQLENMDTFYVNAFTGEMEQ